MFDVDPTGLNTLLPWALWQWLTNPVTLIVPFGALVLGLLKYFGQKWVDHSLGKQLEKFKREQQESLESLKAQQGTELERLRHRLSSRISKIHEKEFEILSKAWLMLNELRGAVYTAVDLTVKFCPDFKNFSQAKLEDFLSQPPVSKFRPHQIDELRKAEDQTEYYINALNNLFYNEAAEQHRVFLNYLIEDRIFMTAELQEKFTDAQRALEKVLLQYKIGRANDNWSLVREGWEEMLRNMQNRIDEVERAVQSRLRYEEAL